MVNLKRLSIKELNQLASNIIEELSRRADEPEDDKSITKIDITEQKLDDLIDKFNGLIDKKVLIDDELQRLDDIIDDTELTLEHMYHDLKIGIDE